MNRPLTALSILSLLACALAVFPARAEDPAAGDRPAVPAVPAGGFALPEDASKALPAPLSGPREEFGAAKPAVSLALCGIEAHGAGADLDAGLIDFNVPDPAQAGGGAFDRPKDIGQNAGDYHSAVYLGVTVGYHF